MAQAGPNEDAKPVRLYRAWRTSGRHVHAVQYNSSLCPLGPNAIWPEEIWTGTAAEVTCPQCLKRLT